MRKMIGLIIILAVFGFTAYLLFQLQKPHVKKTLPENTSAEPNRLEEWLGIFMQGQRVGYSFTKISELDTGLIIENRSLMTLMMMGAPRTINTHLFAHTDKDYALSDFSLEALTAGYETRIEGTISGKQLKLTVISQGTVNTQTIALAEKPYLPDAIEEVLRKKGLKPGEEIKVPYFDPTTQNFATAKIKMFDKETVTVFDKKLIGTRFEIDYIGMISYLWLDDNYHLIKGSAPAMGMEMIPLSKAEALAEIEPADAFDLLPFFAVKLEKQIPNPVKLFYIKLELDEITSEDLDLSDDFQRLVNDQPIIIESYLADVTDLPAVSLPIKEQKEFLEPSAFIQCQDPDIIAQANRFIGDEKDAKVAVGKLVEGVFYLLKKNPTASLPSAIAVLKNKEGDCNEHSVLFAALARAVGIPAKIYVGLINLGGEAYYYHAWCAVWLGKWVPVDPTFNQYPADVGHLKLKEGEIAEQAKVLKVVGKLKIRVLEYKESPAQ